MDFHRFKSILRYEAMKFWEICKSDDAFTVTTFGAGGQKVLSDWQIWRSFMPIRAVEISNFFFIFLFSPPYLDFPPPKPLPSTPQSFFPPFKTFFGTWKNFFFGKFSHFGTFWDFLAKSAKVKLWNLKTSVDPRQNRSRVYNNLWPICNDWGVMPENSLVLLFVKVVV